MNKVASAATSRRSTEKLGSEKLGSEKLDSEEREMHSIDGRGNAHPAKLGAAKKVATTRTEAAPRPWRLRSSQSGSEEAGVAACPWRVQPRRERKAGTGASPVSYTHLTLPTNREV